MAVDGFAPVGAPVFVPFRRHGRGARTATSAATTAACSCSSTTSSSRCTGTSTPTLASGSVRAGELIARLGTAEVNGGWELHLQLFTDLVSDLPGVALSDEADLWRSVCPDPNLLLGLIGGVSARPPRPDIAARRPVELSQALLSTGLHVVRGEGAYLYDAEGREYLDLVNNVAHVDHCQPRVVEAGARQMAALNTNTRYLHESVIDYARRLAATLPDPLHVCFVVNSGSVSR